VEEGAGAREPCIGVVPSASAEKFFIQLLQHHARDISSPSVGVKGTIVWPLPRVCLPCSSRGEHPRKMVMGKGGGVRDLEDGLNEGVEELVLNGIFGGACRVESVAGSEPCLLPAYPWLFYQSGLPARQATKESLLEAEAVSIGGDGTLRYDRGGYSLVLARVPGKEEEVKATMRALLNEIPDWPEAVAFREACETVEIPIRELARTLEEIQLTHYIAGQCDVCRRLGV
jgi:hypothetical protein